MGIEIDEKLNDMRGEDKIVSPEGSKVKVLVIATDEEMMIAKQTFELVTK
jgi:acetate kinase